MPPGAARAAALTSQRLDWTLIDSKKMARDPAGLQRPPKAGEPHDLHDTLMRLAEAGLEAESETIGCALLRQSRTRSARVPRSR